eukprot:g31709.t1
MGEPNEVADQLGEINLAEGFWKSWGELETEASAEIKNPKLLKTKFQKLSHRFRWGTSLTFFQTEHGWLGMSSNVKLSRLGLYQRTSGIHPSAAKLES